MGTKSSQLSNSLPSSSTSCPSFTIPCSFPIVIPATCTHKPAKISNILVILHAKDQILFQNYFPAYFSLISAVRLYTDLCSLIFEQGQNKGKVLTKIHYNLSLSDLHFDGVLKLKVSQKRIVLKEEDDRISYIQQNINVLEDGIQIEDRYYQQTKQSQKQLVFEQNSIHNIRKNIDSLISNNPISQLRRFLHQSYKKSKSQILSQNTQQKLQYSLNESKQQLGLDPTKIIGNMYQKLGWNVSYGTDSSSLSTYSLMGIFGTLQLNYNEGEVQIDIGRWNTKLSDIKDNQLKRITFVYSLKQYLADELKCSHEDIYITKILNDRVYFAYPCSLKSNIIVNEKRIFDCLEFSQSDFDSRGNKNYNKQLQPIDTRGGLPYYKPIGWFRFGLNISHYNQNETDLKDKNWFSKNNQNQWAVMYHGVRNPTKILDGNSIAQKIINSGFKIGTNHVHEKISPFINKQMITVLKNKGISLDSYLSQQIYNVKSLDDVQYEAISEDNCLGEGIYGSPLLNQICVDQGYAGSFMVDGRQYVLVFQCKVKPECVYISSQQKRYWLVRNPKNIRPYGILIVDKKSLKEQRILRTNMLFKEHYQKFCQGENLFEGL